MRMNEVKAEEENILKKETIVENHMTKKIEGENTWRKDTVKVNTCRVKIESNSLEAELREDIICGEKKRTETKGEL